MKKGNIMNTQTFTAERMSTYRRDELYTSAAAIRTSRVSVGSGGSNRSDGFGSRAASFAKRLVASTRTTAGKSPVTASR
jgi:hypothetical protein